MRTEKEEEWVCRGGITSASKNKKKVLQMQVTRVASCHQNRINPSEDCKKGLLA
jgi:hypothetical protein